MRRQLLFIGSANSKVPLPLGVVITEEALRSTPEAEEAYLEMARVGGVPDPIVLIRAHTDNLQWTEHHPDPSLRYDLLSEQEAAIWHGFYPLAVLDKGFGWRRPEKRQPTNEEPS